jgi:hypothetical protein
MLKTIGAAVGGVLCITAGRYLYNLYCTYISVCKKIEAIELRNKTAAITYYDNYVVITYEHLNTQYRVSLPYDRALIAKMSNFYVTAEKGEHAIDISQAGGIPYLVSANDLNVDYIRVYDMDKAEERIYRNDTIPLFGIE